PRKIGSRFCMREAIEAVMRVSNTTLRPHHCAMALAVALAFGTLPASAVVNTARDASGLPFVACDGRVGFRTVEAFQGQTDLTGDGDALDTVLQVLDLSSGIITNVGVDASGPLACGGSRFAFGVSELNAGLDLNGDGDQLDTVLHVYDAASATLTNLGISVDAIVMSSAIGAFVVPEASEGPSGTDLNGDGDEGDHVLHVVDLSTLTVTNVGQEASDTAAIQVRGHRVAFVTNEAAQGGGSLNGDGDTLDNVAQIYDATSAVLTNTQRATTQNPGGPAVQLSDDLAAFLVLES